MNMTSVNGRINTMGAKVPEGESSREQKFPRTFVPGSKSSTERKVQGRKVPGNETSWERTGQSPVGTVAAGSELARE